MENAPLLLPVVIQQLNRRQRNLSTPSVRDYTLTEQEGKPKLQDATLSLILIVRRD